MQTWKMWVLAPAIMVAAACHKNDQQATADSALGRDLNLANQVTPGMDTVTPAEANGLTRAPASAPRTVARTSTRSTSTTRRRSSSGGGTVYSSSGGNVSSQPATVTVKHTKRDAAIGAAAGAVIGATTSRDKVKGAIIGGVVGGILGGVIGNNVDKQKKPPQN